MDLLNRIWFYHIPGKTAVASFMLSLESMGRSNHSSSHSCSQTNWSIIRTFGSICCKKTKLHKSIPCLTCPLAQNMVWQILSYTVQSPRHTPTMTMQEWGPSYTSNCTRHCQLQLGQRPGTEHNNPGLLRSRSADLPLKAACQTLQELLTIYPPEEVSKSNHVALL